MNNLRGMLSNVRIRTRNPRAQQPSDRTLLVLLSTEVQTFLTKLNVYGRNWAVDELQLTITPNTSEYLLSTEGFGKPISVRAVNPGDPAYIERTIDFFELGDLNYDWNLPNNFGQAYPTDDSPHSTQRIAFYRKGGQIYARVMSPLAYPATFNVIYQVGVFGATQPLDEDILLPEHHALIEVRTAIAALPHCEWYDDPNLNAARRKELAVTLLDARTDLEKTFRANIANLTANTEPSYRELGSFDD